MQGVLVPNSVCVNVVLKKEKENLILVEFPFCVCESFAVSLLILNLKGCDFTSLN